MIEESKFAGICGRCGSEDVACKYEYYTNGADLEHVTFTHVCQRCNYVEESCQQGCYGYDNSYECSLRHKDHSGLGTSSRWRLLRRIGKDRVYVVRDWLTDRDAHSLLKQYQSEDAAEFFIEAR
jgi:hypothetical protein